MWRVHADERSDRPERNVGGLAAALGEVGFEAAKPTCHTDPALRRSSSPQL